MNVLARRKPQAPTVALPLASAKLDAVSGKVADVLATRSDGSAMTLLIKQGLRAVTVQLSKDGSDTKVLQLSKWAVEVFTRVSDENVSLEDFQAWLSTLD